MGMTVEELRAACNSLKTALKRENKTVELQEFQMMALYGQYFLAANYAHESSLVPRTFADAGRMLGMSGRIKAVVLAGTPEVAAAKTGTQCLIILGGQSTTDRIVHAEQALLDVLVRKLAAGMAAPNLAIGGCKVACSKCFSVLKAFAEAYKAEYGKVLEYETSRVDAFGTDGNAKITRFDPGEAMPDRVGTVTHVGDLISKYRDALQP